MIKIIASVVRDLLSYIWPLNRKNNIIRAVILVAGIGILVMLSNSEPVSTDEVLDTTPQVLVGTVDSLQLNNNASFIGTVRAMSEAQIQSEVGGRVTNVSVSAGDEVAAGAIIATLENASQRAAVLQAQGTYEAALATAAQSDVSVDDAENSLRAAINAAITTYRNGFNTVNGALRNSIDVFYVNPNDPIPTLAIETGTDRVFLKEARVSLQSQIANWQQTQLTLNAASNVISELETAEKTVEDVMAIVSRLIVITDTASDNKKLEDVFLQDYTAGLLTLQSSLTATLESLKQAQTSIISAEKRANQARISGTNTTVSAANAQVKQALGSLRSAQAALAKTILRSPIAGTVNTVSVNTGDFIGSFTQVAEVANNDALEISVFVGTADIMQLAVGDTVTIENMSTGTITNIAPAIDPVTLKTEVKIATESSVLTNGDTVTVTLSNENQTVVENAPLLVPIAAVKFTVTDGFMFTVSSDTLVSVPVEIGPIVGSFVTITEGIDRTTQFVLDARGLSAGQKVETITK